jgi:hypothetical protein
MADKAEFVFITYANLNHSEVPVGNSLRAAEPQGLFETMLTHVNHSRVPLVFSTQGLDLDFYSVRNPRIIQELRNPNITCIRGIYSHALPSFYPETLDWQLALGQDSLQRAGLESSQVLMLPEFDMFSSAIPVLRSAGLEYVLLQGGTPIVNPIYSRSGKKLEEADLVRIEDELTSDIKGIVMTGKLRNPYLAMLRGLKHPREMIDLIAAECESARARGSPILSFLIDWEAPLINSGSGNYGEIFFHRFIDELARARERGDFLLSGLDYKTVKELRRFEGNLPVVLVGSRPKPKWIIRNDNLNMLDRIRNISFHELSLYHKRVCLAASISDLQSAQFGLAKQEGIIIKLPVKDLQGEEHPGDIVIKSDANRPFEVVHLAKAAETKKPVLEDMQGLSTDGQELMRHLDKVFNLA